MIPTYWVRPWRSLPTTPGMHRWVWDLRYAPPEVPERGYPINAVPHDTPRSPQGPLVVPGTYTVRLTVGEQTLTAPLAVTMDPRVTTSAEGLAEQLAVERMLARRLPEVDRGGGLGPRGPRAARGARRGGEGAPGARPRGARRAGRGHPRGHQGRGRHAHQPRHPRPRNPRRPRRLALRRRRPGRRGADRRPGRGGGAGRRDPRRDARPLARPRRRAAAAQPQAPGPRPRPRRPRERADG